MTTRTRRTLAAAALAVTAVTAGGCTLGNSYWSGPYQCTLEFGPMEPRPVGPPDKITPVLGDLVYEACWFQAF